MATTTTKRKGAAPRSGSGDSDSNVQRSTTDGDAPATDVVTDGEQTGPTSTNELGDNDPEAQAEAAEEARADDGNGDAPAASKPGPEPALPTAEESTAAEADAARASRPAAASADDDENMVEVTINAGRHLTLNGRRVKAGDTVEVTEAVAERLSKRGLAERA